jgi:uncharacterized SAM-binding protein YcdF (DUF218 family)
MRKRGCLFSILFFAVLCLAVWVFSAQLLAAAGSYLIEDDGPRKADAIVVLGGDGYGDRTLKAAELAKEGYAPFVIVSGPMRLMGSDSADEVQYAVEHGYQASLFRQIRLPAEAESTRTEAQYLGKEFQKDGIQSILLVTSNFHTKRAKKLWHATNPTLVIHTVASVDPAKYFTPATWWKTRPGQKIFLLEWMKTVSVMLGI